MRGRGTMAFFSKKKKIFIPDFPYNSEKHEAMIRSSICTGERVIGFKDKNTGKFLELFMIKSDEEIEAFKEKFQLREIKTVF